jgi:hypothetical protein
VVFPRRTGTTGWESDEQGAWINTKRRLARFLFLLLLLGASLAPAAYFYLENNEVSGHGVAQVKPFDNLQAVGEYLLTGTQLGSILRASGLYPSLELNAAEEALRYLPAELTRGVSDFSSAAVFFAYLGLAFSGLLACVYLSRPSRAENMRLFFLGQLVLFISFMLPALARWQYGAAQALSLRYQYNAWFGLALIFLPILVLFCRKQSQEPLNWKKKGRLAVLVSALTLHLFSQFYLGARFSYFTENGAKNRRFTAELEAWEQQLSARGGKIPYQGQGTELSGLYPLYPQTITPGFQPEDVYAVLKWLKHEER